MNYKTILFILLLFHTIMGNQFENALHEEKIDVMEQTFQQTKRNYFYLDTALEEGKEKIVDFFIQKGIQPSLFANQMARINGHSKLANKIETYHNFRNKVSIKDVYYKYDRQNKSMTWASFIPEAQQF